MGRWTAGLLCIWSLASLSHAASFSFTSIELAGATGTDLYGINDTGQIVGINTAFPYQAGFQYENGVFTTLPFPGISRDINNVGQIVGQYYTFSGNRAFLYSGGEFTLLPEFPSLSASSALGINDAGQIVGYYVDTKTPGSLPDHGFLYSNGTLTTIDFPGALWTVASSINNVGQIAGTFRYPGAVGYIHGFVLSNGVFSMVDEPGALDAYPYGTIVTGINDSGDLVGSLSNPSGGCAFIYQQNSFTCFSVPGALYTYPFGINNAGQIVGSYGFSASRSYGFIATPVPEPAALMLVTSGLIALIRIGAIRRRLTKPRTQRTVKRSAKGGKQISQVVDLETEPRPLGSGGPACGET